MTGLGITREQIQGEFLEFVPELIEAFGQVACLEGVPGFSGKVLLQDRPVGSERIGSINRRATHDAYLDFRAGFPKRGGFSLTVAGIEYVPAGETDNMGMLNVCLLVPLVERLVFFSDHGTVGGVPIQFRIEATGGAAVAAGSGAMDVAAFSRSSHRAYLTPGRHLSQGDLLVTSNGDRFTVMDPIQQDTLGDVVSLSREGTGVF